MRKIILLCSVFALGGCQTVSAVLAGSSLASQAPGVSATTEKTLTILHLAFNGLGADLTVAANTGLLHGADAAKAQVYFDKAGDALNVADKADLAANDAGVIAAMSDAEDAITAAKALDKGN